MLDEHQSGQATKILKWRFRLQLQFLIKIIIATIIVILKAKKEKGIIKETTRKRECFFCSKSGHVKADCFSFKKLQQQKNTSAEQNKFSIAAKDISNDHL